MDFIERTTREILNERMQRPKMLVVTHHIVGKPIPKKKWERYIELKTASRIFAELDKLEKHTIKDGNHSTFIDGYFECYKKEYEQLKARFSPCPQGQGFKARRKRKSQ